MAGKNSANPRLLKCVRHLRIGYFESSHHQLDTVKEREDVPVKRRYCGLGWLEI